MKKYLTICLLFIAIIANAQSIKIDGETYHWEYTLTGGLNTDGWQWDTGFTYFPIETIGLKASIGLAGEIGEYHGGEYWDDYYDDYDSYYDNYAWRFKFIPAIVLRTPALFRWKNTETTFHIFAEPGLILSPGASGSKGAKTFRYDFRGGINIQSSRLVISVGYEFSNFSLYSGHPYSDQHDSDIDNYRTHSGFIGLSYKF